MTADQDLTPRRPAGNAATIAGALLVTALALLPAGAEEVTLIGCPQPGVENGCVMLSAGGKLYNVTAARPAPAIGTPGRVTGTLATGVASFCQQGLILTPATWEPLPGTACPAADAPRP